MAYIIEYKQEDCIGAGECEALSKDFWKLNNKGKAELKGAVRNPSTGKYELLISDEEYERQQQVAGSCPVGCICIKKK
ncbi:ferredoxin [Candidatus Woesearchaeota archaeon]|nr:MAG: ferredoxin [Candidatus Woesearchaeota archaeon]